MEDKLWSFWKKEQKRMAEEVNYLRELVWRLTGDAPEDFEIEDCTCIPCNLEAPPETPSTTGAEDLLLQLLNGVN